MPYHTRDDDGDESHKRVHLRLYNDNVMVYVGSWILFELNYRGELNLIGGISLSFHDNGLQANESGHIKVVRAGKVI